MPSRRPDHRSWDAWLWKYAVPALAIFMLFTGVPDISQSVKAARNEGSPGTFTSTRSDCSGRGGCTYYGNFVSDDGAVTLKDVFIDDGVDRVGERVKAQYLEKSRFRKVYELDSHDWVWLGLIIVGSMLYLIGWGRIVVVPWIRKRNP